MERRRLYETLTPPALPVRWHVKEPTKKAGAFDRAVPAPFAPAESPKLYRHEKHVKLINQLVN